VDYVSPNVIRAQEKIAKVGSFCSLFFHSRAGDYSEVTPFVYLFFIFFIFFLFECKCHEDVTWKDAFFCFSLAERQVRCEEGGSKEGRHAQPDSAQNRKPVCRRIQVREWKDMYVYIHVDVYICSIYKYIYVYTYI